MSDVGGAIRGLPVGYEFHHVGYATASIEKEQETLCFLGYRQEGESFVDPVQGVSGCFLIGPGPRIELLENLPGSLTLSPWIASGVKMYHVAYLVANVADAADWARSRRARVIVAPVPAVAFEGRRICFVMFRNGLLMEFVQR